MNPDDSSEINVETLLALRHESDAVQVITERLKVKEMGPADHIRTKHEVKAFLESGSDTEAKALLQKAAERRQIGQSLAHKATQARSQHI